MKEYVIVEKPIGRLNRRGDGDTIDRLSATTTVWILVVASLVVDVGPLVTNPVQCYIPAEMTEAMHKYIERYCFVQDTNYVPLNQSLPHVRQDQLKDVRNVNYYYWIPLILKLQALMFYLPVVFWRLMSGVSGINFNALLTMAHNSLMCYCKAPHSCFKDLAGYIHWALHLHRVARRRSSNWDLIARYGDVYLIVVYLFTKVLYVANAIAQIFLLSVLLQTNDPFYGITMARNLINGTEWQQSGSFPRLTVCDVEIREVANLHRHKIQCVLVLNLFNEKLFILLWFWIVFVAIASTCGLIYDAFALFVPGFRRRFIRRCLPGLTTDKDHPMAGFLVEFVDSYLGIHGVFLLRAINSRVGMVVTARVLEHLWRNFMQRSRKSRQNGLMDR